MMIGDDRLPAGVAWPAPIDFPPGAVADTAAAAFDGMPPELLLQAVAAPVAVVDTCGRILAVNHAFADLTGAATLALVGAPMAAWLRPAEGGTLAPGERPAAATVRHGDGSERAVECTVTAVPSRDARIVAVRDLSDRLRVDRARREIHDLTEQLRRAQKIGALGRLAGGVAHDFNNLLQVIGGYAEALGAERLDQSTRRRLLRPNRGATDRASALTRQLLAFGRRQVLLPEVIDLNVTVRTMERMMGRVIGEHIRLASVLAADLASVRVDPGQIEQVVINLVLNARDAMPGGGTLEIATANVRRAEAWSTPAMPVSVPEGAWVRLTVRDTGTGMDADTAAQAFEPFFTTKDATHGSGLGLSMVYGIVKQSGGYTWIDSEPGAGTAVHVLLPAVADAVTARAPRDEAARPGPVPVPQGPVLLVEDDPEVRALFASFLRQAGYDVVEAADGKDAVAAFTTRRADIDVVITDVVMPNTSGPALAAALRARRPALKILYVSGYAEELDVAGGSPAHSAYLQKPVTRLTLLRQVAALLAPAPEPAPPPAPVTE